MKRTILIIIAFFALLAFSSNAFCAAASWDGASDDAMLLSVERAAFDYFWNNSNSGNYLVAERQANFTHYDSYYSVSAAGMGLVAICAGHKNGWISLNDAKTRIDAILTAHYNAPDVSTPALTGGLVQHNGFFYHFTKADGTRDNSGTELSTVDTSWFITGALFAGQYIADNGGGSAQWDMADAIYQRVNWEWMRNGGSYLKWAWKPESGFSGQGDISGYSEGNICYILAMGSPTHPLLDTNGWNALICQTISYKGLSYIYDGGSNPLFMHQYPGLFVDFAGRKTTTNASFALNTYNATIHQHRYANDNSSSSGCSGYSESFGLSATDVNYGGSGPYGLESADGLWGIGYTAYGTSNNDGTVCLSAMAASINELPSLVKKNIRYLHDTYTTDIWGNYGFSDSYQKGKVAIVSPAPTTYKSFGWVDGHVISHQQGSVVVAIENYRTGLIKNTFTNIPYIQTALTVLGFTSDTVKPAQISNIAKNLYLNPAKTSAQVNLSWLAPGNNDYTGVISSGVYEIRFTTIAADTWDSAPPNYLNYNIVWSTRTNPSDAQSFLLNNLAVDTTYYAWLRITDDSFNWSPLGDTITFRAGISKVSPMSDYNTSASIASLNIVFNGDCFDSGTTVKLIKDGETDILPISSSIQSSTAIIATFNLSAKTTGYYTVIANLGGSSVMVSSFTNGFLIKPMVIASLSSTTTYNSAIFGLVTISGEGFVNGCDVKLQNSGQSDINASNLTIISSTSMSCFFDVVGKTAGSWDLVITTGAVSATKVSAITINPMQITSISTSSAYNTDANRAITIAGQGFVSGGSVKFKRSGQSDILPTSQSFINQSQIDCVMGLTGKATGYWDMEVSTGGASSYVVTLSSALQIKPMTIASVSPAKGVNNGQVNVGVFGAGFPNKLQVKLLKDSNVINASVINIYTSTALVCSFDITNASTGVWSVEVSTNSSDNQIISAVLDSGFLVSNMLINSIDPSNAYNTLWQNVNIFGDGFKSGSQVILNKSGQTPLIAQSINVLTSTAIICSFNLAAKLTGTWDVVVSTGGAGSMIDTLPGGFEVKPLMIEKISPSSAHNTGVVSVEVNGAGFSDGFSAKLTRTGQADILAQSISVLTSSAIMCSFDLASKSTGAWDVVVSTSAQDAFFTKKDGAFSITISDNVDTSTNSVSAYLNKSQDFTLMLTTLLESVDIYIPAGTFNQSVLVVLSTAAINKDERDGQRIIPVCVEISAEGLQPNGNITITLYYTDAQVSGYDETKLVLSRYDTATNRWLVLPSIVYPEQNKVVATTNHLSKFALIQLSPLNALSDAFAYPVPFDPIKQSAGLTFDKLTKDAEIKIYSINGAFVRQVPYNSQNGKAIWDGRDYSGEYVASGVYIALIKNDNEKKIIKIAVEK
ncbi:MAG: hypothetical protein M0Q46_05610 [Endomicrobiales bacterium]|nr:hypothetical protein [Endomicrobiales bacterium]